MNLVSRVGWSLALLFVAGCSNVGFRQLGTVQQLLPSSEEPEYAWRFSFNGMATLVYPVASDGPRVLFANREGLRLHWDGETIYLIEGLPGALGIYRAGIEGDERWYDRDGQKTYRLKCTPMRDWRVSTNRRGSRQECRGEADGVPVTTLHSVERDGADNVLSVEATLIPRVASAILSRMKP
jgi:hypothetical protein